MELPTVDVEVKTVIPTSQVVLLVLAFAVAGLIITAAAKHRTS